MSNIDNTKIEPTNVTKITVFTVYKKGVSENLREIIPCVRRNSNLSQISTYRSAGAGVSRTPLGYRHRTPLECKTLLPIWT